MPFITLTMSSRLHTRVAEMIWPTLPLMPEDTPPTTDPFYFPPNPRDAALNLHRHHEALLFPLSVPCW